MQHGSRVVVVVGGVDQHACGLVLRAGSSGIASFHRQEETFIIYSVFPQLDPPEEQS